MSYCYLSGAYYDTMFEYLSFYLQFYFVIHCHIVLVIRSCVITSKFPKTKTLVIVSLAFLSLYKI